MRSSGKPDLGLIGYGRFGRLAARYLRTWFRVSVADRRRMTRAGRGIRVVSITEAARMPVVVLAVPVNQLRPVLREIAPHLRTGALIIDACAVKADPMRWMAKMLPAHAEYIGTHPLFGPDSAARTLRGHTIVLCPGRIRPRRLHALTRSLREQGLHTVVTTPARHDHFIAETLFLPQFIGRALVALKRSPADLQTPSSQRMLRVVEAATNDTEELLRDIFLHAPAARRAVRTFSRSSEHLLRRLRAQ